jgi:uncharacterized protein
VGEEAIVNLRNMLRPRPVALMLLWLLPSVVYLTIGIIALYQTGWLGFVALSLPVVWLVSWLVTRLWPASTSKAVADGQRLQSPSHWTPHDIAAISIVEAFRDEAPPLPADQLLSSERYLKDVGALSKRLTQHYFRKADETVVGNLTLVELLAIIHLAAADLEDWVAANVPGSKLVKIKMFSQAPAAARSMEWVQNAIFLATAIANPTKLVSYPIWRMAGNVFTELRHELLQGIYQQFLRRVGFYLIEMYSGRLRGGSHVYEQHFRRLSQAVYQTKELHPTDSAASTPIDNNTTLPLRDVSIAIMGQVKAGKSSLLNHLLRSQAAVTSVMPETREVSAHAFAIPEVNINIRLLDTPGYGEDGAKPQQLAAIRSAAESAHVLLLVLSAVSPARQADVELLAALREHYLRHKHLQPPPILAVLTHIDQLSPQREWAPPYDWQQPRSTKEKSIAAAAAYTRESLGPAVRDVVCVYTGTDRGSHSTTSKAADNAVVDALVPAIVKLLPEGESAALLCAYYRQLSERRLRGVLDQLSGLGSQLGYALLERIKI